MTFGLRVCAGLNWGINFQWFSVFADKVGAGCESMILKARMQVLALGIKSHTDWCGRNNSGFQALGYNTVRSLLQLCAFFAEHSSWL